MKTVVDLVYFNAGGGHRAAAQALQAAIAEQGWPWTVRLVNLVDVLDPKGQFRRYLGIDPEDVYNKRLARGWTLGLAHELRLLQAMIRALHAGLVRTLAQHWAAHEPDLVVSLIPNFNRALCESVHRALPGVPFVTVLTDLADYPPHFWIEPGQSQHFVCGTDEAVDQALAAGHPPHCVSRVSGMLLRPSFYRTPPLDRRAAREALGLDPDRPTAAVMYGGQGSMQMLRIATLLPDLQMVLLCGHNTVLAERLRKAPARAPRAVVGFTSDVPNHLRLADFFIGKPGPGCLSEALHLGLPVLTFDNAWTMPQERFNVEWVRQQELGLVVPSMKRLPPAVAQMIDRLPEFRDRTRRIDNRATFELPRILADLLHRARHPAAAVRHDGAYTGAES